MVAITWTDKAKEDLNNLVDFWSAVSENSAKLQIQRIFDKVQLLVNFPRSGRIVPEMNHPDIREHIVGYYRLVYYIVSERQIDILLVHHAARPLDENAFG
jgi:toxin ParE1/3/4